MNQTRLFIVLTAILWLMLPTQSHAQFGKNRPKAFGNSKAEPVWLLPSVEGPNLRYKTFQSASVKAAVSYVIYLPAEYEANKTARYPVVYWLHGKGAGQQGLPGRAQGRGLPRLSHKQGLAQLGLQVAHVHAHRGL
jgi:hypothetical protein